MSSTYNGVAGNATGDTVAITVPSDGDALNTSSANTALQRLADWSKRIWNIVGVIASTAWTWSAAHIFNAAVTTNSTLTATGVTTIAHEAAQAPSAANSGLALQSGYTTGSNPCKFFKDPFGVVHVEGFVTISSGAGNTIFRFPTSYRPPVQMNFIIPTRQSAGALFHQPAMVSVETGGDFVINTSDPDVDFLDCQLELSGITFRV